MFATSRRQCVSISLPFQHSANYYERYQFQMRTAIQTTGMKQILLLLRSVLALAPTLRGHLVSPPFLSRFLKVEEFTLI